MEEFSSDEIISVRVYHIRTLARDPHLFFSAVLFCATLSRSTKGGACGASIGTKGNLGVCKGFIVTF